MPTSLNALLRYALYLRGGASGLPNEAWFGHETGLFLAIGCIIGGVLLLNVRGGGARGSAAAYTLLMLVALALTGRRSGILVLILGVLLLAWLLLPRRPALLAAIAVPVLLGAAGYLNVYWDGGSDAIAAPARAIRSQVDPDARDQSSDQYRDIEKANIVDTLEASPLFGVGFGRPFTATKPLPEIPWWPLQLYQPHQNVLWLWLKAGLIGASVLLGLWLVAFRRALDAARAASPWTLPGLPAVLAAALVMFVGYGSVDHAFVASRSMSVLGVLIALALLLPARRPSGGAATERRS